jgi:cardiolipin synthase
MPAGLFFAYRDGRVFIPPTISRGGEAAVGCIVESSGSGRRPSAAALYSRVTVRAPLQVFRIAAVILLCAAAAACAPEPLNYRYQPRLTSPGADIRATLSVASGFQAVGGNKVTLLLNGGQAFPAMLEAIRSATSSIHLENNIVRDGVVVRRLVAALCEKARAGVNVRLLIDWAGASLGSENEQALSDAGVVFVTFRPLRLSNLHLIHLRTHRKLLIVDGKVAFMGGVCFDDSWDGDATQRDHWRDTLVRVEGPVVQHIQVAFVRAWVEAKQDLLTSRTLFQAEPVGEVACQLMDSTPGSSENPARLSILVSISAAKKAIDATTAYFVPDHPTREALKEAARRGVRVRLLLAGRDTDLTSVRYAGRISYKELLEAGVEIYEYEGAQLHAKTMVVDRAWASVGSVNLDRRSVAFNREANLNVFDEGFATELEKVFEADLARSKKVLLEEWVKRPFHEKFAERMYGIFRPQY